MDDDAIAPDAGASRADGTSEAERMADVEERIATRRLSSIEAGRRKGGLAGAAMAGAMLTLHDIYEGPVLEDDIVALSESPDKQTDIDKDGIDVTVGVVNVWAPPPTPASNSATDG